MPDFSVEDTLAGSLAGIDEAGRGPLAGPVFAAAVVFDRARLPREMLDGLDDSKKLSRRARAAMYDLVVANAHAGIGQASVAEIDELNILQATMLAMRRAFDSLPVRPDRAIIDGNRAPELGCPTSCLIGGDASSLTIAAASIVAKVTRDRLMAALAREHPGYGWRRNAGYGTREHIAALGRLGVTPHHRRTFAPVARLCNTKAR